MRRSLLLLGPVLATVVLFACEDSGSSSGGTDAPDGSGAFEAGTSETSTPDGSVADAADAQIEAGPAAPVTVHVLFGGVAEPSVMVVFHDASGAVLESTITQLDGKAKSTIGTPAMASALLGSGQTRRILTWTGVAAGDELFAEDLGADASSGSYAVTLPGTLSDAGENSANASIGTCSSSAEGSDVLLALNPECVRPSMTILARAMGVVGEATTVVGYAFGKAKPPVAADGGTTTAAVGPWVFPTTATVTPANLPAGSTASAGLTEVSGTLPFENGTGGPINMGTGKASFLVAPGFADAIQASVHVLPSTQQGASLFVGKRVAPAANVDLDFATALPTLNTGALVLSIAKRPEVFWSTVGNASLASTDGGSVAITWSNTGEDSGGWTLIVAPGTKNVKAPLLPKAADPWLPVAASDAGPGASYSQPEVTFVESDALPGYTEFRAQAGRIIPLTYSSSRDAHAVLPVNGTLRATSFVQPVR